MPMSMIQRDSTISWGRLFSLPASRLFAVVAAALLGGTVHAQPPSTEAIVAKAEAGIACVLVSRSDLYRKYELVDGNEPPGKLGGFEFSRIEEGKLGVRFDDSKIHRDEILLSHRLKLDLSQPRHIPEAFGSGIVIDAKGLILTNYHVVQDATKIYVRLPGNKGSYADIWAADPRSDLAVLKVLSESILPLTPIPMGNADAVRRGQQAIALANPYAAGQHDGQPSVSVGVVSNLRRRVPGRQPVTETNANPLYQFGILMQTDARIALGSSGGALLNAQGECIGITTSLAAMAGSDAAGGFAMPVNSSVRKIIEVLAKGEEVEYGFLGVTMDEHPAPQGGALIKGAAFGSPAATAGLTKGDAIVAIGGSPVRDNQDLMLALGQCLAGERTTLTVARFGMEQKTNVALVKYSIHDKLGKQIASSLGNRPYVGGIRVDFTSILAQRAPQQQTQILPGVLVVDVQKGSKAERLQVLDGPKINGSKSGQSDPNPALPFHPQLIPFDTITHVAGVSVSTPAAFYEQVRRHDGPIELTIRRGNEQRRARW